MKSDYHTRLYQKQYYNKNKDKIIKRILLRYNNEKSGRNNKTDTSFNYGKYIIEFN